DSLSSMASARQTRSILKKTEDAAAGSQPDEQTGPKAVGSDRPRKMSKPLAVKAKRSTSIASDAVDESAAVTGRDRSTSIKEAVASSTINEASENAASGVDEQRQDRDRESGKVSRRQSIKNQRSLPAMFGLVRSKSDDKPLPPVPPLPSNEYQSQHQPNAPNLGRRFLSAFRSNSGSDISGAAAGSDTPFDTNQSSDDRPSTSGEPAGGETVSPTQSEQTVEPRRSHSSSMVRQLAP
ncbi:hypothetical protein EC988_009531, partial [Linderina pennispora]